jgi:hypothetical protein
MLNRRTSLLAVTVISAVLAGWCFSQTSAFDRAMVLFHQQNWPEAAAAFAALEKQQPGQTDAFLIKGSVWSESGDSAMRAKLCSPISPLIPDPTMRFIF